MHLKGNVGRASLVCMLCIFAVLNVDKLEKMVSLLGALFGVPLALIIPSWLHLTLVPHADDRSRKISMLVIGLGFILATTCSCIVIYTW
jgi:presenilin-like A22 family membrane protease